MSQYNHTAIEKKWRENWEKHPINVNDGKKEKYYCLDMFPYRPEVVCTLVTGEATLFQMYGAVISCCAANT
mgnify:FL=1